MALTLDQLNACATAADFAALLEGVYEHSPWIAERAWSQRPFVGAASLKFALAGVVRAADREAQLGLIRAHPELAGKAKVVLTTESSSEQQRAGLAHCSAQEFEALQGLNAEYTARFGWPFILAVRGPRGLGLSRSEIIATFERRLHSHPEVEFAECLRNIHRIAELRLNDKLGIAPVLGEQVWAWAEALAEHSDEGAAERGELTVTYLTDAHRACAAQLQHWMREVGFDETHIDAVGNVVGTYHGSTPDAPRLLTGSHYDTVRNGGKLDGRLGIFAPMAAVQSLHRRGRRLPVGIEVIGFAEEEGQRYKATFLGSGAVIGQFNPAWLAQADAQGVSMREAMAAAGLREADIAGLKRDPRRYLGFVEVHVEQGPVLNELDVPLGVVTSINGSVRFVGELTGLASHAGTTPMNRRRDAAAAVAELLLFVEKRAAATAEVVGTVGMLEVPSGSINVVPGRCKFSLDIRATSDAVRDACVSDVLAELARIAERRGVRYTLEETMRVAAAPSDPAWQQRWEQAVESLGVPLIRLPSGAGHDAMKLHEVMPQAMLFVRGMNGGISHNPLECSTADDMDLAVRAFLHLTESAPRPTTYVVRPPEGDEQTWDGPAFAHEAGMSHQQLDAWIDAHFDDEVRFLQALVRVPTDTPPGDNAPHAVATARLLAAMGLHAEQHAVPTAEVQAAGMVSVTNLIVRRPFSEGGPLIALNAHGDVVPPGEGWTHDPYGGEIVDGRLYGRASAVSKSDFATYTFALRALESLGAPLRGGIELHFTYDEEFGGELGPGWLLRQGLTKPDLLIAAGFAYQVVTAHNGCLQMEVTVHGVMAHAAIPHTGVDALQGATAVLNALYACNAEYKKVSSSVPGITHPYVNVGRIEGGTNTNVVPGKVVLRLDRRMIPEEDPHAVEQALRRMIESAAAAVPGVHIEIKRLLLARALQPLPGHRALLEAFQRHGQAVLGDPIPEMGSPLYTDARLYGERGVAAVIYGAGPRTVRESNAKRADEHLVLSDLKRATQVVARVLYDLLSK